MEIGEFAFLSSQFTSLLFGMLGAALQTGRYHALYMYINYSDTSPTTPCSWWFIADFSKQPFRFGDYFVFPRWTVYRATMLYITLQPNSWHVSFQKPFFPHPKTTFTQFFPQLPQLPEAAARRWAFCYLPWSTSWHSRSCSRVRDPSRWFWNPRENWRCKRMRPGKSWDLAKKQDPNGWNYVSIWTFVSLGVVGVVLGWFWVSLYVSGWILLKEFKARCQKDVQ